MRAFTPRTVVVLVVVLVMLAAVACSSDKTGAAAEVVKAACARNGHATPVCACVYEQLVASRGAAELDELAESDLVALAEPLTAKCTILTGALAPAVEEECLAVAPVADAKRTICECAAPRIATDERVRDVTERLKDSPMPMFAQEIMYDCAYEKGAIEQLLLNTCGGDRASEACQCLLQRFPEKLPAKALAGMAEDTLRANVVDLHERCLVESPTVKNGLMQACSRVEKKAGVCACAVDWFLEKVPPRDVLALTHTGWTTESMNELNEARRECGSSGTKGKKKRGRR